MPLLWIVRFLLSLFSVAVLAIAAYLLWSWYDGTELRDPDGTLRLIREDWRLWTGVLLLAWSFGGGFLLRPVLGKPDKEPFNPHHGPGELISSPTGNTLWVETLGAVGSPTLILTHGWGVDSTIWEYQKRELATRFRLVLWDLPGLGRSKATPRGVRLDTFARDLAAVVAWSGANKPIVVGHSIGGMTIQTLARDFPELVRESVAGVVLVNTTFTNPLKTMILPRLLQALRPIIELMMRLTIWLQPLAWLGAWQSYLSGSAHLANRITFGPDVTRAQLNHTSLLVTRNSQAVQAKGNLAMFSWDATGALARAAVPVLVLAGDMDIVTKEEAGEYIASTAPGAEFHLIGRANHMGFLEQPAAYSDAIARFAQTVGA